MSNTSTHYNARKGLSAETILEIMYANPGIKQAELATALGVNRQAICYHLRKVRAAIPDATDTERLLMLKERKESQYMFKKYLDKRLRKYMNYMGAAV